MMSPHSYRRRCKNCRFSEAFDLPKLEKKLVYLDQAQRLEDLRVPPANQLEALRGNRRGQHGMRINRQWRICFVWRAGHAYQVEIVNYRD